MKKEYNKLTIREEVGQNNSIINSKTNNRKSVQDSFSFIEKFCQKKTQSIFNKSEKNSRSQTTKKVTFTSALKCI